MQPFRAPRKRTQKKVTVQQDRDSERRPDNASPSRRSPRRKDKSETEVHVVPYVKGIKMMSVVLVLLLLVSCLVLLLLSVLFLFCVLSFHT